MRTGQISGTVGSGTFPRLERWDRVVEMHA